MCDGYAQSTQHARAIAWLERGPLMVAPEPENSVATRPHTSRLSWLQAVLGPSRRKASPFHAGAAALNAGAAASNSPASR